MSATAILNDVSPILCPNLKITSDGNNFPICSLRFLASVDAKSYLGHFDGTEPRPVFLNLPITQAQADALVARDKAERNSKTLISQKVPDSVALLLNPMPTVADMWNHVVVTYSTKGAYAQTNLRSQFLQSKCPASGNVRDFLDTLSTRREELATLGVVISGDDFRSTIIGCLHQYLSGFASAQLSAAKLFTSTGTIPCGPFMTVISEEYDRKQGERKRGKGKDDVDEALAATEKGKGKPRGTCWNCGEKGHFSRNSKTPKKPKDSTPPAKSSNGTAAAVDWDSDSEGAWAIDIASDSDEFGMPDVQLVSDPSDGSMPDLQSVSNSDDESDGESGADWFSELGDDADDFAADCGSTEELSDVESWDYVRDALDAATHEQAAAVMTGEVNTPRSELYDSGTTRHITPFRDEMDNFVEIPPRSFNAANKSGFSAVGMGDMVIDVPNGVDVSKLHLTEVLYSPEVGYTLISMPSR
ncbi:hypothetical protein B0H14DRAFT_3567332 [Mycena olivaceomarginata]|nr:hypothetical protein B0H14DRAFT_3567332 [Mycena olivaceomarginata]